ncbi:MAG TPA: hypothetical protein VLW85_11195 [Myxococcales bacterium]|nr:hypothetical protein [Myxococcales bacterium]
MRATDRQFWAVLLGLLLVTRIAGFVFGVVNLDEDEFCVIGSMIGRGALSYVDVAEFKPPLTHFFFVPAGMFGGISIWPMRVLGALWLLCTCLVLRAAAREWTGDELAGKAAAILALLASVCEVPSISAEMLMNLPLALALLFWIRGHWLRAGLLVGLASLFKQQGAILLCAFAGGLLYQRKPARLASIALGFCIPWLASCGYWAWRGHLIEFFDWTVVRNLHYANAISFDWRAAASSVVLCLSATAVPWVLAVRQTCSQPRDPAIVLSLWLTWVAVAAGGRFYEHYFLQFVTPLAVMGAPAAARLLRSADQGRRRRAIAAATLCVCIYITYTLYRGAAGLYPNQDPKIREVSGWLREHTAPDASVFVWGHAPQLYFLSQRRPASRYLTAATQIGGFDPGMLPTGFDVGPYRSVRDIRLLVEDLEAARARYVVDTAPADIHHWRQMPLAKFPELEQYLREHYRVVASPANAEIFERMP